MISPSRAVDCFGFVIIVNFVHNFFKMSRLSKGDPCSFSEPGIYFGIKRSTNEFKIGIRTGFCNSACFICILVFILLAENLVTRHIEFFWNVDFTSETVSGEVLLHFDIVANEIDQIVSIKISTLPAWIFGSFFELLIIISVFGKIYLVNVAGNVLRIADHRFIAMRSICIRS